MFEKLNINKQRITENTMTRLKEILLGQDPKIKSFCIGTPENPMGNSLSSGENKKRCDEFEDEMKELKIPFIKIVGSYGNKEHSYILPNLDLNIAKEIFGYNGYDQESFIVGESNANGVDFYYYYQKNEGDSKYELLDAERNITMMNDAEDFFSSKKSWKFKIDFSIFRESIKESKMSDIDLVFKNAMKIENDDEKLDYIFNNLTDIDDEEVIRMWDNYLDDKDRKIKRCIQGGLGMATMLPTNSVYRGNVIDPYNK